MKIQDSAKVFRTLGASSHSKGERAEDDNPSTALEKLHLGAYDFNRSAKGRRYPVKTVAEACEFGSAKIFKEQKIWIKTKEPVLVVPTNNIIPTE